MLLVPVRTLGIGYRTCNYLNYRLDNLAPLGRASLFEVPLLPIDEPRFVVSFKDLTPDIQALIRPPRPSVRPPVLAGVPREHREAKVEEFRLARDRLIKKGQNLRDDLWALPTTSPGGLVWQAQVRDYGSAIDHHRRVWWAGDAEAQAPITVMPPDPITVIAPFWRAELVNVIEANLAWLAAHDASE